MSASVARPPVSTRFAGASDLPQIAEIEQLAFADRRKPLWRRRAIHAAVDCHTYQALVAVPTDNPHDVLAWLLFVRMAGEIRILRIAVHPCVWRRGVGRTLVAWASRRLQWSGLRSMWVALRPDDDESIAFFRACGFVATHRASEFLGERLLFELPAIDTSTE